MSNFINLELTVPREHLDIFESLFNSKFEKWYSSKTITKPQEGFFTYTLVLNVLGSETHSRLIWFIVNYTKFMYPDDYKFIIVQLRTVVMLPKVNSQIVVGYWHYHPDMYSGMVLKNYQWNIDFDHYKLYKETWENDNNSDWVKYTGEITTLS